jgi:hypothetical protein
MNIHQPIIPIITTILPNVSILGNQFVNPNIGHMVIHYKKSRLV